MHGQDPTRSEAISRLSSFAATSLIVDSAASTFAQPAAISLSYSFLRASAASIPLRFNMQMNTLVRSSNERSDDKNTTLLAIDILDGDVFFKMRPARFCKSSLF